MTRIGGVSGPCYHLARTGDGRLRVADLKAVETNSLRLLEAQAALRRIRDRAEAAKLGTFDWSEWKAFRDEGRP